MTPFPPKPSSFNSLVSRIEKLDSVCEACRNVGRSAARTRGIITPGLGEPVP
jgi:hypothetical protein